jgi:hypothetical protein
VDGAQLKYKLSTSEIQFSRRTILRHSTYNSRHINPLLTFHIKIIIKLTINEVKKTQVSCCKRNCRVANTDVIQSTISYFKLHGDLISRQYIRDYKPIYSQLFSPALESKHSVTKPTLELLKASRCRSIGTSKSVSVVYRQHQKLLQQNHNIILAHSSS